MDECHCGVTRGQALAFAKADAPEPRKPLTLLAIAVRLGAAAAVIVTAIAVYLVYAPETQPPVLVVPPTTLAPARPSPVAPATPAPAVTPWDDPANWELPPPPPVVTATHPPAAQEPTETDLLRVKTEQWRARYRPVAERVAQLQREVVLLEAGDLSYDRDHPERNADIKRMNDLRRERLAAARKELEQARQELTVIEEGAQQDGIGPGQLR